MRERPEFLDNSIIIAAHADDELLWFNSILHDVDQVVIVFRDFWAQPQIGAQRAAALADYPRGNVACLGIQESGAIGCADWTAPVPTDRGIALGIEASRRGLTRLARLSFSKVSAIDRAKVAQESVVRAYDANFLAIEAAVEPLLRPGMNVFTHNPWGEYGHEEHVQVFRVLQKLRDRIGFRLWMSNYCTERSMPLAMRYFDSAPGGYVRLPTDKAFAEKVADVYKKHGCWTWADDWTWFDEECFMQAPGGHSESSPHRHLFPLNFFTIDGQAQKNWLPLALTVSVATAAVAAATLSE